MPIWRLLVVEDEFLTRLALAEVLSNEGFEVFEAATGDEAVELIDDPDGFDAVVTDINMPGKRDGIAVAEYARQRHPMIPIIYCTGRPDALRTPGVLGSWDVLVKKPYAPVQVVEALYRLSVGNGS